MPEDHKQKPPPMGILNINKPLGWTSHDVVAKVRRLLDIRRVGHAGTLDPLATGVLVVCLGAATRLSEYLSNTSKVYLAAIRLGIETETWDSEGQVISRNDLKPSLEKVATVLKRYRGVIRQTPPMYSAVKHRGQPLYRLARRGITVDRPVREVQVYDLELLSYDYPLLCLRIECSKGTYVRSLAHDIGQDLNTGAYLASLERVAVGALTLQEAVTLEMLEKAVRNGGYERYLVPLRRALAHMPAITVSHSEAVRLAHGQAVRLAVEPSGWPCCAYDSQGRLVAILRQSGEGVWRPAKVLISAQSDQ